MSTGDKSGLLVQEAHTALMEHTDGPCTVISVIMPPPLDVKGGIITEKVFPVFSESFFWTCFGLVMYIWELMDVTERLALQM